MAEGEPLLPELARSLRTLGVSRGEAQAAHAIVFAPLLEARGRAAPSSIAGALTAFRGTLLSVRIDALAVSAASAGQVDAGHRRARVARAQEILEPLRQQLARLDAIGATVPDGESPRESSAWAEWIDQLRDVFALADVACGKMAALLAEPGDREPRRWCGRLGSRR